MPTKPLQILKDAQTFYVSEGYGSLPSTLTADALLADKNFCNFFDKYKTAYQYYSTSGYPEFLIQSHMKGIDFKQAVELVTIPAGQIHTQTQVAWGIQGNYYSTSKNTPEMMGISPEGAIFDPTFVPPYEKSASDEKIDQIRNKMLRTLSYSDTTKFDEVFPSLPQKADHSAAPVVTKKSIRSYEAESDVLALKSTAKEVKDTWSVPNKEVYCPGGGMQLYVTPEENKKMKQYDWGAHDAPDNVRFMTPK